MPRLLALPLVLALLACSQRSARTPGRATGAPTKPGALATSRPTSRPVSPAVSRPGSRAASRPAIGPRDVATAQRPFRSLAIATSANQAAVVWLQAGVGWLRVDEQRPRRVDAAADLKTIEIFGTPSGFVTLWSRPGPRREQVIERLRSFDRRGLPLEVARELRRGLAPSIRYAVADDHALYVFSAYETRQRGLPSELLRAPLALGGKVAPVALPGLRRVLGYNTAFPHGMGLGAEGVELLWNEPGRDDRAAWTRLSAAGVPTRLHTIHHQNIGRALFVRRGRQSGWIYGFSDKLRRPARSVWRRLRGPGVKRDALQFARLKRDFPYPYPHGFVRRGASLLRAGPALPANFEFGVSLERLTLDGKRTARLVVRGQKSASDVRLAVYRPDDDRSPIALLWQSQRGSASESFALRRLDVPPAPARWHASTTSGSSTSAPTVGRWRSPRPRASSR